RARPGRTGLGRAARPLGDPRRPLAVGRDGRLQAGRGERAPRVEGPKRSRRGRVRADQDRRLGRLRRGEDPPLRGVRGARRLVRSRFGPHPRAERLHRGHRPHGRPPVREGGTSLQTERTARNRRLRFRTLTPMRVGVELIVDFLSYLKDQLFTWLPLIFLGLLVYFFWRMLAFMPRVKPTEVEPDSKSAVGWEDIAGVDEAAAELQEVVDFLQNPKRFSVLGARVPKGILIYGPPGTGKTLLAKAVAHASGATFYSQSASAFVEMF